VKFWRGQELQATKPEAVHGPTLEHQKAYWAAAGAEKARALATKASWRKRRMALLFSYE
jgi:hypothetical protein